MNLKIHPPTLRMAEKLKEPLERRLRETTPGLFGPGFEMSVKAVLYHALGGGLQRMEFELEERGDGEAGSDGPGKGHD